MSAFNYGPFSFTPAKAGVTNKYWTLTYGSRNLGSKGLPKSSSQGAIIDAFEREISEFIASSREEHDPARICLIDSETGDEVAHFFSGESCGMTPGMIDDRSGYWIRSENRLRSRSVSLTEFAKIASQDSSPTLSWIAGLLPDSVLTKDARDWRAPSAWEIRHIVGEGSFTHISGARAAELVGVSPQNFRKYTASDEAKHRQSISFAMWHLLLHKLGVQRA